MAFTGLCGRLWGLAAEYGRVIVLLLPCSADMAIEIIGGSLVCKPALTLLGNSLFTNRMAMSATTLVVPPI
jgi:hypothetical protein